MLSNKELTNEHARQYPRCQSEAKIRPAFRVRHITFFSVVLAPFCNGFAAEVQTAFDRALADEGKIVPAVLSMRGMSGKKYRRFDNWSEFDGPVDKFLTNLAKYKGKSRVTFIEKDYHQLDFHHLGLFNVFLFDGPHTYEDQFDAVMMADPALEPCFVLIVDDWNWESARRGTMDAIRKRGYRIDHMIEVRTSRDDTLPELRGEKSDWHNGYFIAALRKTS